MDELQLSIKRLMDEKLAAAWEAGAASGHSYGMAYARWVAQGEFADPRDEPTPPQNPWAPLRVRHEG